MPFSLLDTLASLSLSLSVTLASQSLSLSLSHSVLSDPRLRRPQRHWPKPTQAPSRRSTSPTHTSAQSSISTLTQRRSDHCFGFLLFRPICLRPTSLTPIRPTPTLSSSPKLSSVIGDFVWSRLRKKIEDLGLWFFFPLLWTSSGGCRCGCG